MTAIIVVTSDPAITIEQDTPAITIVSPVSVIPQQPLQGISLSTPLIAGVDFNTVILPGFYYTVDTISANVPVSGQLWYLQVSTYGGAPGFAIQTATEINTTPAVSYTRLETSGAWGDWVQNLFLTPQGQLPAVSGAMLTSMTPFTLNYLSGFNMSISTNTVTIAAGSANDSTNTDNIVGVAITKTSNAWVAGTNQGGLDSGTLTTAAWVHVHAIWNTNTLAPDALLSLSASAPVLPSGFSFFRRIGSLLWNGAGNFSPFSQNGDEFLWITSVNDVSTTLPSGSTPSSHTLTVPTGVKVNALFHAALTNAVTAGASALITSTDQANAAVGTPAGNASIAVANTTTTGRMEMNVRTNTSAQINAIANFASTTLTIATYGWIDRRGKT